MGKLGRIVVKVGSNVLTREDGLLNVASIKNIVTQIASLKKEGVEVILVSSGAVASGREQIQFTQDNDSISRRQVLASAGQARLMHVYYELFEKEKLHCAQVLVTKEDFRDKVHYKNMQNCLAALLRNDIIPIVNENDVVSITELMFTDNDELAGVLTSMIDAEALVILTNVDGLFTGNPADPSSELIAELECTTAVDDMIGKEKSSMGRGGMKAKVNIAQKVAKLGASVFITNGYAERSILSVLDGSFKGTKVKAAQKESDSMKWIAHSDIYAMPVIELQDEVSSRLEEGKKRNISTKSITQLEGEFKKGDVVRIINSKKNRLGVGMVNIGSTDFSKTDDLLLIDSGYLYLN